MEIKVGMEGEIVVLELVGNLVAATAEPLKLQINKLLEKNFNKVMLEMSRVNFMDSSGLGCCMAIHKQLKEKNGILVCARPSEAVAKIFRVTRADQKMTVVASKIDGLTVASGLPVA